MTTPLARLLLCLTLLLAAVAVLAAGDHGSHRVGLSTGQIRGARQWMWWVIPG